MNNYDENTFYAYNALMTAIANLKTLKNMGVTEGYKPIQESISWIMRQGANIAYFTRKEDSSVKNTLLRELLIEIVYLSEYACDIYRLNKDTKVGRTYIENILASICNDLDQVWLGTVNVVVKIAEVKTINKFMKENH